MKRISLNKDTTNQLQLSLEANMQSLRRRSISYTISAHSDDLGTVSLTITGKRGKMTKDYICKYDTIYGWEIYSSGVKWRLTSLSEIQSVLKSDIQKLSSTVNKI